MNTRNKASKVFARNLEHELRARISIMSGPLGDGACWRYRIITARRRTIELSMAFTEMWAADTVALVEAFVFEHELPPKPLIFGRHDYFWTFEGLCCTRKMSARWLEAMVPAAERMAISERQAAAEQGQS